MMLQAPFKAVFCAAALVVCPKVMEGGDEVMVLVGVISSGPLPLPPLAISTDSVPS